MATPPPCSPPAICILRHLTNSTAIDPHRKVNESLIENAEADVNKQFSLVFDGSDCRPDFAWCDRSGSEPELHVPQASAVIPNHHSP